MTQLRTQLYRDTNTSVWTDVTNPSPSLPYTPQWVIVNNSGPNVARRDIDHITGDVLTNEISVSSSGTVFTFSNGDSIDNSTGIYTFADGQPNRFQTATINPTPANDPVAKIVYQGASSAEFLTLISSVIGGSNISVDSSVPGQVTISLASEIDFASINVTGNATIGGDASITGAVSANTITTVGAATIGGNASVTGNASITGDASVTGNITVDNVTASGNVNGVDATFTGSVAGKYMTLDIYEAGQTPPTPTTGGVLFLTNQA